MEILLTREQTRELDRLAIQKYGVPSIVLMENAGRGVAEYLLRQGIHGPVVICCGKGNNGGDGFVIARHLINHGVIVKVLLFANPEELTQDAKTNYEILIRSQASVFHCSDAAFSMSDLQDTLSSADWVVDALLGTGLQGEVKAPLNSIINAINTYAKKILAVDIPSGLDCDTGKPLGVAIKAQHTLTFMAMKKGFVSSEASPWVGNLSVVDIGIPIQLLTAFVEAHVHQ